MSSVGVYFLEMTPPFPVIISQLVLAPTIWGGQSNKALGVCDAGILICAVCTVYYMNIFVL